MKYVKFLMIFSLLAISVPNLVSAATTQDIQAQIQALQQQLKALQEQLATAQQTTAVWCHDFNVNLRVGDSSDEVAALYMTISKEGLETQDVNYAQEKAQNYFGEGLASAVTGFQQKYADEILTPLGLQYGTGYVGSATRTKLNKLYGCGGVSIPTCITNIMCADGYTSYSTDQKDSNGCVILKCIPSICPNYINSCPSRDEKIICPTGLNEKGCPLPCKCVPPTSCTEPACQVGYISYDTGEKDSNGCPIKKCIPPTSNQPPTISGVSGPTTLKVNEIGTWTVKASDPEQGVLSYSVFWGDETTTGLYSPAQKNWSYTQSATFTHSFSKAGAYNPTFTVTDNQGLSAKTSISVNVGEVITPSITVLSPNGGESWQIGSTQTIKWQDNTPMPTCSTNSNSSGVSSTCIVNARLYDINLATYSPPCPAGMACATNVSAIYTIAKNISINYYSWTVGAVQGLYDALAPEGSYTIQVCQSGTNICDSSDSYFKIISGTTQPSITVLSPNGGESWKVGGTYTVKWNSSGVSAVNIYSTCNTVTNDHSRYYDIALNIPASNEFYNWNIDPTVSLYSQCKIQITDASNATVNDTNDNYFSIVAAVAPSITVLSPNGGESWKVGETKRITWQASGFSSTDKVKIYIDIVDVTAVSSGVSNYVTEEVSASQGYYDWTIVQNQLPYGSTLPHQYKIRINQPMGPTTYDSSDAAFSIVAATNIQPAPTIPTSFNIFHPTFIRVF